MKFEDYKYERPNLDELKEEISKLSLIISDEFTGEEQLNAYFKIDKLINYYSSMQTLASIRFSLNTTDEFYKVEQDFFDVEGPNFLPVLHDVSVRLAKSIHRPFLEEKLGKLLFLQTDLSLKTFDPKIVPLLQEENKLVTSYSNLISSAEIHIDGKTLNLSQMAPYITNINKDIRKEAQLSVSKWMESKEEEFDSIYDSLVIVRNKMAKELGYENYVQLGYDNMQRTDYNYQDVSNYRKQILEHITPLYNELMEKRAKRLNVENPKSYDLALSFLSGNPTPKGNMEWMIYKASEMYKEMSPETHEFFKFMNERNLLDLDARKGKDSGGYCTYIEEYKSPFIFANFNGTQGDVDVLTHEAGHAFQVYMSRDLLSQYRWPTMEAAEIHSMSMEFFAWPWIHEFFKEDTDKYKFSHLEGAILFLPYGALVDEYQHYVYENPNVKPNDRKLKWRELEKKYLPIKDYGADLFLEKGTYWYRQGHIFASPFYYIDYTLAQVIAFQYLIKDRENHKKAWNSYLELCKLGGKHSFVELINIIGMDNPFIDGTLEKIVKPLRDILNNIDDSKF